VTYLILIAILAVLGLGLWLLGRRSRDVDEDLKYLNEGQTVGLGIFAVLRRHRE
jgi:hypothetical protein